MFALYELPPCCSLHGTRGGSPSRCWALMDSFIASFALRALRLHCAASLECVALPVPHRSRLYRFRLVLKLYIVFTFAAPSNSCLNEALQPTSAVNHNPPARLTRKPLKTTRVQPPWQCKPVSGFRAKELNPQPLKPTSVVTAAATSRIYAKGLN